MTMPGDERGWRDIASAPRDGTRIMLWFPYTSNTEATCADEGYWEPLPAGVKASIGLGIPQWGVDAGGCFRFTGGDGPFDIQPTKWRPLPPTNGANIEG